jgi:enamine deaminase RidA (YjgF/YER057c/UK114 family)
MRLVHPLRRGGPFLFLGTQVGRAAEDRGPATCFADLAPADVAVLRTGNLMIDAPAERAVVQTCRILRRVESLLAAAGGSLDDIVAQRFFVRHPEDLAAVARAIVALVPGRRPSTTLVAANAPGFDPDIAVHADFVALARPSSMVVTPVTVPGLDFLSAPFPLATRAGPYVFTSPVAGVDLATGRGITSLRELDESARAMAEPPYTRSGEAAAAQQIQVFRHVERILAASGTSLAWQVRQNGWLRIPMRAFGPASAVRRKLFAGDRTGPFTSLTISGLRDESALFEYGVIALMPPGGEADAQRAIRSRPHGIASYYVAAVQAGPLIVTAGEVPVDTERGAAVQSFATGARDLANERIDAHTVVMAQAHDVYEKLARVLSDHGATMPDVVHQTLYVLDGASVAAIERIATLYFGPTLPPTTVVPIASTSPFPESRLEIELIAAMPH